MKFNLITFIQSVIIFTLLFYILIELGIVPEKYALIGYTLGIFDDIILVLIGGYLIVKLQKIKDDFETKEKNLKKYIKKLK